MTEMRDPNLLTYSDDFQRPDGTIIGYDWLQLRGEWSLVSRALQPTGNTGAMVIAQAAFVLGQRFTVEATVSVNPPGGVHNGLAFNIQDRGNGLQDCYALTLMYGNGVPSVWALWNIENSAQRFLPAFEEIDIAPGKPYTLRVAASRYGWFDVTILDGTTELVAKSVQLDPFDQQLSGGSFGAYSQSGNTGGVFQMTSITAQSTTAPSSPYAPPAAVPLTSPGPVHGPAYELPGANWSVVNSSLVDQTQSIIAVGQTLLTQGNQQYVAYYNANRQMSVAMRSVDSDTWVRQSLNTSVGTDGHNSVTCALDRDGQLHVSGNMHNVPLIYFRTMVSGDVTSLTPTASMVNPATEQSVTYPGFLHNGDGALIFNYRYGVSGNGTTYYNIYDESSKTWSRLFDQPMFDGQGVGNAYPQGPTLGPDGYFHMMWVWRLTGDGATNFNLSYARSKDLVHWETAGGDPLTLPLTKTTAGVVVDPVPPYDVLLNGQATLGFDAGNRPLIAYFKLDKKLNEQAWIARPSEDNGWEIVQVSNWTGYYFFQGIGGVPTPPALSPVTLLPDGNLALGYSYTSSTGGFSGTWILNPTTLQPFTEAPLQETLRHGAAPVPDRLTEMTTLRSTFPSMRVVLSPDTGSSGSPAQRYWLRYEALPAAPGKAPFPDPAQLQVYLAQSS